MKKESEQEEDEEAAESNIKLCPVHPLLRMLGLDKKKPPVNHKNLSRGEVM